MADKILVYKVSDKTNFHGGLVGITNIYIHKKLVYAK